MKYKKPYFDDRKSSVMGDGPLPVIATGLAIFLKTFEKEIIDKDTYRKHVGLSQMIIQRSPWFFWNHGEIKELTKRAKPFIALVEESYIKDPIKTVQIFEEIITSYSEVQHAAYVRDTTFKEKDDHVKKFNMLFDEYRFRYEELFNRLISISYACIQIIMKNPPASGSDCINRDANEKFKTIEKSDLPTTKGYEKIGVSINGIKTGIRNAISHGGRVEAVKDKEKFVLKDSSGWSCEYTVEEFRNEMDILDRSIFALECGATVVSMNHILEINDRKKQFSKKLSQEEQSESLFTFARDCELEIIDAESTSSTFSVKVFFKPVQPRESEVFGNFMGGYYSEKIPARLVVLKDQVIRFIHFALVAIEPEIKTVTVEVYTYGDKLLARLEMADARGFDKEASERVKNFDDLETKKELEDKYIKWTRFDWADGEAK